MSFVSIRLYFNPPTRKGWDPSMFASWLPSFNFNPPTRKGWDNRNNRLYQFIIISIHPPARGGTGRDGHVPFDILISIHPPARGGTAKVHKTNFAFYTKSTKIALPFSLYQTLSSFYFPIACYLAHSSGANHAYYFCSLPLRTARPLKYFTSDNRLWQ